MRSGPYSAQSRTKLGKGRRFSGLLIGAAVQVFCCAVVTTVSSEGVEITIRAESPPSPKVNSDAGPILREALSRARAARLQHPGRPIAIELPAGTYRLNEALKLGPEDSGTQSAPLIIRPVGGSDVEIVGSQPLPTALAGPDPSSVRLLPAASRAHVLAFRLPPSIVRRFQADTPRASAALPRAAAFVLIQDRQVMRSARWPNTTYETAAALNPGVGPNPTPLFKAARAPVWAAEPALWVGGFWANDWAFETAHVTSIEPGTGGVHVAALRMRYPMAPTVRYFVYNALSELDEPGEYVIDPRSNQLLVWPAEGGSSLEAAAADHVIDFRGAHDIRLEHLRVGEALNDGVVETDSTRIVLFDCLVQDVGSTGVAISGGTGDVVQRTVVSDTGEGGVSLSGGDRQTLTRGEHAVTNSVIVRFGGLTRSYRPGVQLDGVGQTISGSFIADGPHSAIMFDGNDHRIQNNEIDNVVTETADAGVIDAWGEPAARGTRIEGNYIHHISRMMGFSRYNVYGIYLDEYWSGTEIYKNLFYDVSAPVFIHGGSDNSIVQNAFVKSSAQAVLLLDMSALWPREAGAVLKRMSREPYQSALYRSRYPGLSDVGSKNAGVAMRNRIGPNLLAGTSVNARIEPVSASGRQSIVAGVQKPLAVLQNGVSPTQIMKAVGDPYGLPVANMDRVRGLQDLPFAAAAGASLH